MASQTVLIFAVPEAKTFAANFSGSYGTVGTNPTTASITYTVLYDGSQIGTVAVSSAGAFTFATDGGTTKALAAGHRVTITAPSPADATCADVGITLVAT